MVSKASDYVILSMILHPKKTIFFVYAIFVVRTIRCNIFAGDKCTRYKKNVLYIHSRDFRQLCQALKQSSRIGEQCM